MKTTTASRLLHIMKVRNLKQIDILRLAEPYCKKYGVKLNKNDLSQYVNGKVVPGQSKLYILGQALNVSEAWLMGYDVPMNKDINSDVDYATVDNIITMPQMKKVPLLGTIACGEPILAEENIEAFINMPAEATGTFALRCKGDSMINARIFDGDIVYIREQPDVENGEIAAVLIENEATLKKVYKYPNRIELRAENPTMKTMEFEGEEMNNVRIIGKAVYFLSPVQ